MAAELTQLDAALDQVVPAKAPGGNIVVGTWNLRAFSDLTKDWQTPAGATPKRNFADVSSVDLTRNPVGLARALRTISDDPEVLEVANRATQHLYIVNPIKSFEERSKSMWDTHPPIAERIRILQRIAGQMGVSFPSLDQPGAKG